jgi:hypothetical protein
MRSDVIRYQNLALARDEAWKHSSGWRISAIVREGPNTFIYVQHTPERFEFRQITLGRTFGDLVQISNGLRDVERVVVRGADKMPRK